VREARGARGERRETRGKRCERQEKRREKRQEVREEARGKRRGERRREEWGGETYLKRVSASLLSPFLLNLLILLIGVRKGKETNKM
jgi:hypothetical protein